MKETKTMEQKWNDYVELTNQMWKADEKGDLERFRELEDLTSELVKELD